MARVGADVGIGVDFEDEGAIFIHAAVIQPATAATKQIGPLKVKYFSPAA